MTLRKKLIDYPVVTPTLNDHVAGNQASTVKQFKFSTIYNLFKAGYDTVYATIIDLGNYVTNSSLATTLTNYVTNSSLAATLSSYVTDSELTSALNTKQNVFTENTATGGSTVTINQKTGTGIFNAVINAGTTAQLTINNTTVNPSKRIFWSLMYDFDGGGTGIPTQICYNAIGSGVTFYVTNTGAQPTNKNIHITFEVLN